MTRTLTAGEVTYLSSPSVMPLRKQWLWTNVLTLPAGTLFLGELFGILNVPEFSVAILVLFGGISIQVWLLMGPLRWIARVWWRYALLPAVGHDQLITNLVRNDFGFVFRSYFHVNADGMDLDGKWSNENKLG